MTQATDIRQRKENMRAAMRQARQEAARAQPAAGMQLVQYFLKTNFFKKWAADLRWQELSGKSSLIISFYYPLTDELDCLPLAYKIYEMGHQICLPVLGAKDAPLAFRQWQPDATLVQRSFGLKEPDEKASLLQPDILFVPLLAFDAEGWRLGYGGGYYDRTLNSLRKCNPALLAIGLCYAAQEVPEVPHGPTDERLDYILTPESARQF